MRPRRASETSSEPSPTSSAPAEGPNPLGLEDAPAFAPDDERPPTAHAADLEHDDEYVPAAAEPIEWTTERAVALLRPTAALVHYADPLGREPGADDLWRLTEQDAHEIGEPLARILNRYSVTRSVAGLSDELALGIGLVGYGRRNLVLRGQLVAAKELREGVPPPGPFEGAELVDHLNTTEQPLTGMHGEPVFPPPPSTDVGS